MYLLPIKGEWIFGASTDRYQPNGRKKEEEKKYRKRNADRSEKKTKVIEVTKIMWVNMEVF